MRKHWQTDWINFELWEPIGLTTNSKKHVAVLNFLDYSFYISPLYGPRKAVWLEPCIRFKALISELWSVCSNVKWNWGFQTEWTLNHNLSLKQIDKLYLLEDV